MAVTFTQQKNKQRYFLIALGVLVPVILTLLFLGFFSGGKSVQPGSGGTGALPANINFDLLKDQRLERLESFEQIPPFEGEVGRDNPFIPF